MTLQHERGHPEPGSLCFTPTEIATFLSYAIATYDVDPKRVYLTGLSCGAFGAWEYLSTCGDDHVAAVVPIAGEGRPAAASAGCARGAVPIWAFHGLVDDLVNPAGSNEPVAQLQSCPSPPANDARLSTYPDADHDSWTRTYAIGADDDIYTWMLGHQTPLSELTTRPSVVDGTGAPDHADAPVINALQRSKTTWSPSGWDASGPRMPGASALVDEASTIESSGQQLSPLHRVDRQGLHASADVTTSWRGLNTRGTTLSHS